MALSNDELNGDEGACKRESEARRENLREDGSHFSVEVSIAWRKSRPEGNEYHDENERGSDRRDTCCRPDIDEMGYRSSWAKWGEHRVSRRGACSERQK